MKRLIVYVSNDTYKKIQRAKQWLLKNGLVKPGKDGNLSDYAFLKFCVTTVLNSIMKRMGESSG